MGNNLAKGRKVLVEGRIQVRNYEGKDGIKRYVTEVIAHSVEFMDYKTPSGQAAPDTTGASSFGGEVFSDEEIPF